MSPNKPTYNDLFGDINFLLRLRVKSYVFALYIYYAPSVPDNKGKIYINIYIHIYSNIKKFLIFFKTYVGTSGNGGNYE